MSITIHMVTDRAVLDRLIANCHGQAVRIVHDGVTYGIYQEFGTYKMRAHPFMVPAADAVVDEFMAGLGDLKNLEQADAFVDKTAHDLAGYAQYYAPVDTGALRASIKVSEV
jgi:hypothetical protein